MTAMTTITSIGMLSYYKRYKKCDALVGFAIYAIISTVTTAIGLVILFSWVRKSIVKPTEGERLLDFEIGSNFPYKAGDIIRSKATNDVLYEGCFQPGSHRARRMGGAPRTWARGGGSIGQDTESRGAHLQGHQPLGDDGTALCPEERGVPGGDTLLLEPGVGPAPDPVSDAKYRLMLNPKIGDRVPDREFDSQAMQVRAFRILPNKQRHH